MADTMICGKCFQSIRIEPGGTDDWWHPHHGDEENGYKCGDVIFGHQPINPIVLLILREEGNDAVRI